MDLTKLTNKDKKQLCRWYFKAGCYCLPLVWLVNVAWFFKYAFIHPEFEEQKSIRKLVVMSAIGVAVWAVIFATWITVFQTYRVSWGEYGDAISVITPTGYA